MNRLENFLNREDSLYYDFLLEDCSEQARRDFDDIERYFVYTIIVKGKKCKCYDKVIDFKKKNMIYYMSDPDGSDGNLEKHELIFSIYDLLWKFKPEGNKSNAFDKLSDNIFFNNVNFGPDTINSVRYVIERKLESEYRSGKIKCLTSRMEGRFSANYISQNIIKDIENKTKVDEDCIDREIIKELIPKDTQLRKLIEMYHTLGNFVLVPAGFNGYRGTNRAIEDYYDRSLEYLRENGYESFKNELFIQYVNYFFLWGYFEENGTVKKLSNNLIESQDIEDYCKKIVNIIEKRGRFMFALLKYANENKESYQNFLEKLYALNKIGDYKSMRKDCMDSTMKEFMDKEFYN